MKVLYLFREREGIRIPYFGFDIHFINTLLVHEGIWNKTRAEFIVKREIDIEQLSKENPGLPLVLVDENSIIPIRIFGFFERPWDQKKKKGPDNGKSAGYPKAQSENTSSTLVQPKSYDDRTKVIVRHPLTQYFPEYWEKLFDIELRSRKYSPCTMVSYIYYNRLLCITSKKEPENIQLDDIKQFLAIIEKDKNYSSSSMNLAISAIKFFYKKVVKKDIVYEKTRPRRDRQLPMVLDKSEINSILDREKNIKHRLLLMLVYSSGLRVSEVVAIKREHLDLVRRVLHVRLGKGRKDRFTMLSEKAVNLIEEYCALNNIQEWIFPGQTENKHLTIRSAQHIFDTAIRKANIQKKVSIHSLRHTFATHLLEGGTDIRYIQALLGHSSVRTTERYTHIARRNILNIKSPLDTP